VIRLREFLRVLLKLAVAVSGVGVVTLGLALPCLGPSGCGRRVARTLLASAAAPILLRTAMPSSVWETGRVVRVIDGDTYEVLVGGQAVRVRLLGVDAPEASQPFGAQATDSVRAYVGGRLVRLQRHGLDLYGRTLGGLRVPGASAEQAAVALDSVLVVRGWAWAFAPTHALAARAGQQLTAQRAGRGLWKCGPAGPVPPKVWRGWNATTKRRYLGSCSW
jgi:micrococcal nuclease